MGKRHRHSSPDPDCSSHKRRRSRSSSEVGSTPLMKDGEVENKKCKSRHRRDSRSSSSNDSDSSLDSSDSSGSTESDSDGEKRRSSHSSSKKSKKHSKRDKQIDKKKRKKEKKEKKRKKKMKKEKKKEKRRKSKNEENSLKRKEIGPTTSSLLTVPKTVRKERSLSSSSMTEPTAARPVRAPMTKAEWEAQQSIIRRVRDPKTGRDRLIKGDGEILEEIVTKDRHREINKQSTLADGMYYQSELYQ